MLERFDRLFFFIADILGNLFPKKANKTPVSSATASLPNSKTAISVATKFSRTKRSSAPLETHAPGYLFSCPNFVLHSIHLTLHKGFIVGRTQLA